MCNVLHEIPPEKWKSLFGRDGQVTRLLKPTGKLLVLEDVEIPHGENAHRFGFLILDHQHLFKLLACTEREAEKILTESDRDGRLKAYLIDANLLGRTTADSTKAALNLLVETAKAEIQRLRKEAPGSHSGRLHGLWTQLFANAALALEALG